MIRLGGDRRGNATIEFAMISLFFFAGVMVALDLGLFVQQKLRLSAAVEQAAIYAYVNKVQGDTGMVGTVVTTADPAARAPTIGCNGIATCGDGKCSCVTAGGGFLIQAACNAVCTGAGTRANAYSGNYLTISASQTYTPMIVPTRIFGGATITQTAVVRLPS